jgi:hypothetical protein
MPTADARYRPDPALSELEFRLLQNIVLNDFTVVNGAEPESLDDVGPVWSNCLDQSGGPNYLRPRSIPGLVTALGRKGLLRTDGECVSLTPDGFAAYKNWSAFLTPGGPDANR